MVAHYSEKIILAKVFFLKVTELALFRGTASRQTATTSRDGI
jgi:hypothetical protein